jgi:asparagine synthase (glutamine-hydrolysing)
VCGFAGILTLADTNRSDEHTADLARLAQEMAGTLRHRGPDDDGWWADPGAGIALAHRRLAVVDLSARGHQPMRAIDSDQVLLYNGEVYNHRALRTELVNAGQQFRGHSDTEVLAALIARDGVPAAVQQINGAFSFALWSPDERTLWLARDRIGEKPLYYAWCDQAFIFGSELKAVLAHPGLRPEIDRDALALYFSLGYVPAPYTIYRGVWKLRAGSLLALRVPAAPGSERITRYWSPLDLAAPVDPSDDSQVIDELDELLRDAVQLRCGADVPVGAFLSGGIDSAGIVALMRLCSSGPVHAFTAGFREPEWDETARAAAIARVVGVQHHVLPVTSDDLLATLAELPGTFDEPFYDAAQIPTILLARLARGYVTVVQAGEGSDEIFGGYPQYRHATRRHMCPNDVYHDAYHVRGMWRETPGLVPGSASPRVTLMTAMGTSTLGADAADLMLADTLTWLPDDVLVKVDRATMAAGLEARCPYLDHRIIELAHRLPMRLKVRPDGDKIALRRVLARYLPDWACTREKQGFALPLAAWLRGPLRGWAEELLDELRFAPIRTTPVFDRWQLHQSGSDVHCHELWTVLMFALWAREALPSHGVRSAQVRRLIPAKQYSSMFLR